MVQFDLIPNQHYPTEIVNETIAASGNSTQTIHWLRFVPNNTTVYFAHTGTGTPLIKIYAVTSAGDIEIGTSTATSGYIELTPLARDLKIVVSETGTLNPIDSIVTIMSK